MTRHKRRLIAIHEQLRAAEIRCLSYRGWPSAFSPCLCQSTTLSIQWWLQQWGFPPKLQP